VTGQALQTEHRDKMTKNGSQSLNGSFWTSPRKTSLRRWSFYVHFYAGLIAGILFSVVGITGSILVFVPELRVLEVPGHCPGSLCFFSPKDKLLIGGDVLFAGSIGRGDLPGGDIDLLLEGIRKKIFPLGDDVIVLPGHGPATRIGTEKKVNPFFG